MQRFIEIDDNICGACGKRATMFFVHGYRCKEHEFQHEPSDAIFGDNITFVVPGLRGVAQSGLERGVWDAEVGSSNLLAPSEVVMANICSIHQHYDPDCELCNTHPRDMLNFAGEKIFPDWDEKVREAKEAGLTTCEKCLFEYYRTTDACPKSGHPLTPAT